MIDLTEIANLFDIKYGVNLDLNKLEQCLIRDEESISFVSRTEKNNGISAIVKKIANILPNPENTLSVAGGGSVLATFLQTEPYYSGRDLYILIPKREMTQVEMLFYAHCISKNKYRYNYGRQANRTLRSIKVPAKIPDWVGKINSNIPVDFLDSINSATIDLEMSKWQWFRYDKLFKIERGRGPRVKDIQENGITPFITSIDKNNGLTGWTNDSPIHSGNVISVNRNGSVAEAFYQPLPFCSTEDVHIFNPKFELNSFIALFLISLIKKEKYRYSYGRKWGIGRMNESQIKLPVTSTGEPDWEFMENYIKSLPYSKSL